MAKQTITTGTIPADSTGDTLNIMGRKVLTNKAAQKTNENFNEVYGVNGILKSNGSDTLSSANSLVIALAVAL